MSDYTAKTDIMRIPLEVRVSAEYGGEIVTDCPVVAVSEETLDEMLAELNRCWEALEWYAHRMNYAASDTCASAVTNDNGYRARRALGGAS